MHFHLFLSGCGMGSLETCTHVILMPESHTHFFSHAKYYPPFLKGNKNVVISGMCGLKGDINVVISDILNMARVLSFAYCVESQTMFSDYPVIVPPAPNGTQVLGNVWNQNQGVP